jgi:hypothetical protein
VQSGGVYTELQTINKNKELTQTDFNLIFNNGIYYYNGIAVTNAPEYCLGTNNMFYGFLEVNNYGQNNICEQGIRTYLSGSAKIAYRRYDGVAWGQWEYGVTNEYLAFAINEKMESKWTDNKTIYKKTIIDTMPITTATGTEVYKDIDIPAFDKIIKMEGMCINSSNNKYVYSFPFITGDGIRLYARITNGKLRVSNLWADTNGGTFYITIYYTKP